MEAAKSALISALEIIPPNCKYNVISFGSEFESLFSESQPKNDINRF